MLRSASVRARIGSTSSAVIAGALVASALLGGACHRDTPPAPASTSSTTEPVAPPPEAPSAACAARGPRRLTAVGDRGASSAIALAAFASGGASTRVVLAADRDEHALHVVDADSLEERGVTPLEGEPEHVLVLSDGRVAVSLRDAGRVAIFEPGETPSEPMEKRCDAAVAAEPWGLAERGDELVVTSGFGAALTVLRSSDLHAEREVPLPREPRAVLLSPDGSTAFVSHAAWSALSVVDLANANAPVGSIALGAGKLDDASFGSGEAGAAATAKPREARQAYALAATTEPEGHGGEGFRLLVPNASVDPGTASLGTTSGYGGDFGSRPVAEIVSVVDPVARQSMTREATEAHQSSGEHECILPRGAAVRGTSLFVACLDEDRVVEYDATVADPVVQWRRSFRVLGGPSSIAIDDRGRLFVWTELVRSLTEVDLTEKSATMRSMLPWDRDGGAVDAKIARGRYLFHQSSDGRIAPGRACASCHPEGRDDGLVWTSPDGRRQTPMLAGRLATTAPYGWFGENATVKDHVHHTMERLGGTGLEGSDADKADFDALLAYVGSLPLPPSSPARNPELASAGQRVFETNGCASCHSGGTTDHLRHDVGTGAKGERSSSFDCPSLVGIRGSAPYFHDGRYATLDDLLTAKDHKMFDTTALDEHDRASLVAYLDTL